MTYAELLDQIKKIEFAEKREEASDFFEFVIHANEEERLGTILQAYFGPPLKPAGEQPSKEAKKRSADYGGVRANQTLYFRSYDSVCQCVLLWPWGNGTQITVKMIVEEFR